MVDTLGTLARLFPALPLSPSRADPQPAAPAEVEAVRARRVDSSQQAIVAALRKAGCKVWVIGWPCDLLVQYARIDLMVREGAPQGQMLEVKYHRWQTLEVKSAYGKKAPRARSRKDQERQTQFLKDTDTPVVTSPEEALRALHLIEFNLET